MSAFIVYALPRSRTFWLSRFLCYGEWHCGHEQLRYARGIDDVRSWLSQPCTGSAETLAAPFWRMAQRLTPTAKTVVVRRPIAECVDSYMRLGLPGDRAVIAGAFRKLDRKLDQIEARVPGAMSVKFSDLAHEDVCAKVFEHCLPYRHDPAWWAAISQANLQVDMRAMTRFIQASLPQLTKLAKTAKHREIAAMARPVKEPDGLTIQTETLDSLLDGGKTLFAEHCCAVEESPDAFLSKNIALYRAIETLGGLQITTARCNGRMFGYLLTILAPSLEADDMISAVNTLFFASPEFRNLGVKLQRASIEFLKARGVTEVAMRAGARGSGPKMGALYRRLGAAPVGEMYLLNLKEA